MSTRQRRIRHHAYGSFEKAAGSLERLHRPISGALAGVSVFLAVTGVWGLSLIGLTALLVSHRARKRRS
jgi:hypothetical protein